MTKKVFFIPPLLAILILFAIIPPWPDHQPEPDTAPVLAPFEGLDTLSTNDWWNRDSTGIINLKVPRNEVVAFGIYTVANYQLRLTAQLFPLYPNETRVVRLEIQEYGDWKQIQQQKVNDIGWATLFVVPNWNMTQDVRYHLRHGKDAQFEGMVRRDPIEKDEIVMAALSFNSNQDRGMQEQYVSNVNHQNPDILFFTSDQSYEHTAAWLKFGLQFRETFRNRPCLTNPDDHDIGQGNLWGEGGKKAENKDGTDGGYYYDPVYVKMVERAQTAHLPTPFDATLVEQGIGVYYTNLIWGNIDLAIIEDRKFKSGPRSRIPQQGPRPDHIYDPNYDPSSIDLEGLTLLCGRQLNLLNPWAEKKKGVSIKAMLSQTGFSGSAHLHGSKDNRLFADLDANGWPQTGRNKALKIIKKANALHFSGDQHLASVIHHGIEEFRDGPYAILVPAILNNYYNRWWWPLESELQNNNPIICNPLPWTGDFQDGFGNKITLHAYANPDSPSFGTGYGLIRFNKTDQSVTFECWPREVDVCSAEAQQFSGWPVTVNLK